MSAQAFHAIATQFRDRYLHPLQFRRGNTIEDRVGALEHARQKQGTPEVPAHGPLGQENTPPAATQHLHTEVQRVGEDHRSDLDAWHAKHSSAASDLLHTFNSRMGEVQAQSKPSGGAWDDFHAAFGSKPHAATPAPSSPGVYNQDDDKGWTSRVGAFQPSGKKTPDAPLKRSSTPQTPPAAKPQRVVQAGLFGPSQVRAPQQFGLAATEGPRPQGKPTMTAPRGPRVTQPGLFPKSAVKKSRGFPPHREIG
jgi:hypothetical protein